MNQTDKNFRPESEYYHVRLMEIYDALFAEFGAMHWWPGDFALEICLGAILTQNTAWHNADKALRNLEKAGMMDVARIAYSDSSMLSELIRPSGYYNQKARKLIAFSEKVIELTGGDVDKLKDFEGEILRRELLSVNGIGPETADDCLLYAFEKPFFVVDAYTRRILNRHGLLLDPESKYDAVAALFMKNLPPDVGLFNEYHALIVHTGKRFCHKSKPLCDKGCPLNSLL